MHIPLASARRVALFRSAARFRNREMSDLRWARELSESETSFRLRIWSTTDIICTRKTETKPATAVRTKAGAVASEITRESWSTSGGRSMWDPSSRKASKYQGVDNLVRAIAHDVITLGEVAV